MNTQTFMLLLIPAWQSRSIHLSQLMYIPRVCNLSLKIGQMLCIKRIIAKCEKTEKITSLSRMAREAVDVFYDEYDYYPDIAVYAPGAFTIMGDHLEYVKGNLVQGAMPLGAVVVGKSLCSVKCKVSTTSRNVEGLRKSVFPISHYKKNLKVFPEWVNYIKGVINVFPMDDVRGFDAVIHSNVPFYQGYGSSAALQVGFYTFLEAVVGKKTCEKKAEKGNLCCLSEAQLQLCEKKLGRWSNFTSAVAEANTGVKINCRTREVSTFDMREINILFLLTYPNFEIERYDRDFVCRRKMELALAAHLLGLEEIIDATEHHLGVLENMEDPTKESVINIMQGLGYDEECVLDFVEDLFSFPKIEELLPEYLEYTEGQFDQNDALTEEEEEEETELLKAEDFGMQERKFTAPCIPLENNPKWVPKPKPPPVSYIHERLAELCAGRTGDCSDFPQRLCDEINCLGGIENLSVASELTVCGKLLKRVRHIVTENLRSLSFPDLMNQLDYEEFGTKLIQSHLSLKLDYEVSCTTLDSLVQLAIDTDRVYGAKMTSGGGTLTLLHRSVAEKFIEKIIEKFGEGFQFYLVFPGSGAKILHLGMKSNPKSTLSDVYLNREELTKVAVENFEATYKYRPTHGAFSPGVVNLIGNHTDYNHGFSVSVAVNLYTVVVGALNGTSKIRIATTGDVGNESPKAIFSVPQYGYSISGKQKWAKILKGVVSRFKGLVKGFDCLIQSSVPCGAGASAKTALVMAFYTFLEELGNEKGIKVGEKAYQCMLVLQEFSNTVCGVGDNLVAGRSKEGFAVLIDSWTTATTLIPFQDPSVTLLLTIMESEPKRDRSLLCERLEECYQVAKALGGKSLRCLTLKDLDAKKFEKKKVPQTSILRATHVLEENERALKAAEALKNNDFEVLGELMIASHNSLRDKYEVLTPEVDCLVATAMEVDGVLGSKVPFSGLVNCTISLVKRWAVDDLIEYLRNSTTKKLTFHVVNPSVPCGPLNIKECLEKFPSPQFTFENVFPF